MKVKLNSGVEYWVSFYHNNYSEYDTTTQKELTSNTNCIIVNELNPGIKASAFAFLAKGDIFCKDRGRKIALRRALNQLGLSKEVRTLFWNEYHLMTNKLKRIK